MVDEQGNGAVDTEVDVFGGLETRELADAGVEVEIMKADGESSGIWIKLLGQDSEQATKLRERQERQRIRALAKGGRAALDGLFDTSKVAEMELTVACCQSWRHVSGKPMPFAIGVDEDETRAFFKQYPLVYEQVRIAINDRMNFTKGSAKR